MDALKGFRTMIVAFAGILTGAGAAVAEPTNWAGWVVLGLSVAMAILRKFTDTPLGQKAPPPPEPGV